MTTPLRVNGADISHYQARIDLGRAKASGLQFLYHKATEGVTYTDPMFIVRRIEAKKAGIPFGAYHFARPDGGDARDEARRFISIAKPKPGDLIPMLDLEVMGGLRSHEQLKLWAKNFVDEVQKLTGIKPGVYGSYDLGDSVKGCVLWRPRYNNTNTPPKLAWDIWQFSDGVYGNPSSYPGLGRVDLNTFRKGFGLSNILIPEKEAPKPAPKPEVKPAPAPEKESVNIRMGHFSGQFSDTDKQHTEDANKLFLRAKKQNLKWVTGTEAGAGSGNWAEALKKAAAANGFRFFTHPSQDSWVAVRNNFIKGGWETHVGEIIVPGKAEEHTSKRIIAVGFDTHELGRFYVAPGHFLTRGQPNPDNPAWSKNLEKNKAIAEALGEYAEKVGRGTNLFFYAGDNNINDREDDVFLGEANLTTLGDELKKWENTGHGPIDVIASSDADLRVKPKSFEVFNDKELHFHTDHFYIEGAFSIRKL